jgi:cathepsin D
MGLGFQGLSSSGATPWWEALAKSGAWSDPEFGFFMRRYRDAQDPAQVESEGGEMMLGYVLCYARGHH